MTQKCLDDERSKASCGERPEASCVNALSRGFHQAGRAAAIDRKIARAGKDRARLQPVEAADRMAEMGRVGIADVLREMREIEILVGEMQKVPRALPGPERAEGDASLLLEQMQKARLRQPRRCGAVGRSHRLGE